MVRSSVFSGENLNGERCKLNDKCHFMHIMLNIITFNVCASLSAGAADFSIRLYFQLNCRVLIMTCVAQRKML